MARRAFLGIAALLVALYVSACGAAGGGDESGGDQSTMGSASPSGSGSGGSGGSGGGNGNGSTGGNGGGGGGGGGGDDGFEYTPWGPDDPPIPGQYAALAVTSSQDLRCEAMAEQAPGGEFWVVAEGVCSTIRDGTEWAGTPSVPSPPDAENEYQDCLNAELAAMIERALRWYADNPGRQPEVAYAGNSAVSPCQARIYAVEVLPPDAAEPGENEAGKIAVAVTAPSGRDGDLTVTVGGQPAEVTGDFNVPDPGDGLQTVVVLFDPQPQPRQVTLEVSNGRGPMSASVQLPGTGDTDTDTGDTDTGGHRHRRHRHRHRHRHRRVGADRRRRGGGGLEFRVGISGWLRQQRRPKPPGPRARHRTSSWPGSWVRRRLRGVRGGSAGRTSSRL